VKWIEITVSPTGATRLQTQGFRGTECRSASAPYEKALGVLLADIPTAEFYAQEPASRERNQQSH
jgi:hypothetical protein